LIEGSLFVKVGVLAIVLPRTIGVISTFLVFVFFAVTGIIPVKVVVKAFFGVMRGTLGYALAILADLA
jgi:hypothetical protein